MAFLPPRKNSSSPSSLVHLAPTPSKCFSFLRLRLSSSESVLEELLDEEELEPPLLELEVPLELLPEEELFDLFFFFFYTGFLTGFAFFFLFLSSSLVAEDELPDEDEFFFFFFASTFLSSSTFFFFLSPPDELEPEDY